MGNPNDHGGYYFVVYNRVTGIANREKGSFRHYIQYCETGTITYYTEHGTFTFEAGDFYYLPIALSHNSSYRDCKLVSCGFTHFPEAKDSTYLPQKLPRKFLPRFLEIPKNISPDTRALAQFYGLLADLLPHMKKSQSPYGPALLERIRIFVWRNYTCRVEDIALHCQMSVPTLYRVLKQTANTTPNRIKQEILIEKAMLWLRDTNSSVRAISDGLGFCNPNYFTKVFKAHTGKTPQQYRMDIKKSSLD